MDELWSSLGAARHLHCQRLHLEKKLEGKRRMPLAWVMGRLAEKW